LRLYLVSDVLSAAALANKALASASVFGPSLRASV